jgi:hypothetical protein
VADLVNSSPAAAAPAAPPVSAYIPPVVAAYLPVRDTNVAIGIQYPSGSSDFVYLVAGIRPPGGDPRLPAVEAPVQKLAEVSVPAVTYEPAEIGSGAVMVRTSVMVRESSDSTQTFPPGAFVRGGLTRIPAESLVPARGSSRVPVYYRQATTSETGEDLIWNFPPGSRLVRNAAASTGQ